MVSFPPFCWNHRNRFFLWDTKPWTSTCVCVCARAHACLSLSLSLSLYLSLIFSFSLSLSWALSLHFLSPTHPQPPPPPQLPGRDPTFNITVVRSILYIVSKNVLLLRKCWICWICSRSLFFKNVLSAEMLNMLNVFRTYRPLLNTPITWGGPNIQHYSWKKPVFQKSVPFCGNVEYVEYVQKLFLKNMLLSAEMLNMLNMLNIFWTYRPLLNTPSAWEEPNIQHYSWKKHFFLKKMVLSAEMLNMLNMF